MQTAVTALLIGSLRVEEQEEDRGRLGEGLLRKNATRQVGQAGVHVHGQNSRTKQSGLERQHDGFMHLKV